VARHEKLNVRHTTFATFPFGSGTRSGAVFRFDAFDLLLTRNALLVAKFQKIEIVARRTRGGRGYRSLYHRSRYRRGTQVRLVAGRRSRRHDERISVAVSYLRGGCVRRWMLT
jgi:hypothetical protein